MHRSRGAPLDQGATASSERRLGHDFGSVRVGDERARVYGIGPSQGVVRRSPDATDHPRDDTQKCRVSSFRLSMQPWDVSWPWFDDWFSGTKIRLPVDFELFLADGVEESDCYIGQQKRGYTKTACDSGDEFKTWTPDGPRWWDGNDWNGGDGLWHWPFTGWAVFHDKPGFNDISKSCYPLYWGGVGRTGHFEFRTDIGDVATGTVVRSLTWGMLIDYSAPKVGTHKFFL